MTPRLPSIRKISLFHTFQRARIEWVKIDEGNRPNRTLPLYSTGVGGVDKAVGVNDRLPKDTLPLTDHNTDLYPIDLSVTAQSTAVTTMGADRDLTVPPTI